jgi:hypothetical protein
VVPAAQTLGLPVQDRPAVQAPQKPLPSQVWPPSQEAPEDLGAPSTQLGPPLVHETTPARQELGLSVHAAPATQLTQTPCPSQTRSTPQVAPAGVLSASTQLGVPDEQSMTPRLHGEPGLVVQAVPAAQATHWPLPLHTWLPPQLVPGGALGPSSQAGEAPQLETPSLQGAEGFT